MGRVNAVSGCADSDELRKEVFGEGEAWSENVDCDGRSDSFGEGSVVECKIR